MIERPSDDEIRSAVTALVRTIYEDNPHDMTVRDICWTWGGCSADEADVVALVVQWVEDQA